MTFKLYCPACGHEQYCGCIACLRYLTKGLKPWIWVKSTLIKCGGCAFTQSEEWWAELDYEVTKKKNYRKNKHDV